MCLCCQFYKISRPVFFPKCRSVFANGDISHLAKWHTLFIDGSMNMPSKTIIVNNYASMIQSRLLRVQIKKLITVVDSEFKIYLIPWLKMWSRALSVSKLLCIIAVTAVGSCKLSPRIECSWSKQDSSFAEITLQEKIRTTWKPTCRRPYRYA